MDTSLRRGRDASPFGGRDARAVSTVLDVALCLLLVSASVLTLAGTPLPDSEADPRHAADAADETAETLATSTARVTYQVDGGERRVHDTLAGLLVSAARADARPGATSSARTVANSTRAGVDSTPAFVAAVTETVGRALRRAEIGVQVVARSTAEDGSRDGRVVAGETPPPNADVHAAALAVRRVRLTVRTWER